MSTQIDARSLELIKDFRTKVPIVHNDNWVHLNQAGNPPTNEIVIKAINDHLNQLCHIPLLRPLFESNISKVKGLLAEDFNIDPGSLLFTRNSCDGSILFSLLFPLTSGDNILMMENEYPFLQEFWTNFCESRGIELKMIKATEKFGVVKAANFQPFVDSKTKLIIMTSVRYDTGTKNDVKNVTTTFRKKGIEVLVDFCQDVALNRVDLTELQVSAAVFSCFKGYCLPFGIGGFYVDPKLNAILNPVFNKTEIVCENFEPFSAPHLLVATWEQMLLLYRDIGIDNIELYLRSLGERLRSGLEEIGVALLGNNEMRSSHSYVYNVSNPQWFEFLLAEKIVVTQREHVRVAFGLHNNEDDIDRVIEAFKKGLKLKIPLL